MSLLSDERIFNTILQFPKTRSLVPQKEVQEFARAIEAAVLEELAKQKPAYTFHLDSTGAAYLRGECVSKEGDPLYAAPVVQEKQEPWPFSADRVTYHKAAPVVQQSALERYNKIMEGCSEKDPVERLRFFCSLAMSGQDWLDVERFFDDLTAPVVQEKQEPVAWLARGIHGGKVIAAKLHDYKQDADNTASVFIEHYGAAETVPLYAAPVVQPDMVMVPREATEAMLDAAMNRYKHVSPEARLRFFQMHRENFRCDYKAMIAAAEWKSNAAVKGGAE